MWLRSIDSVPIRVQQLAKIRIRLVRACWSVFQAVIVLQAIFDKRRMVRVFRSELVVSISHVWRLLFFICLSHYIIMLQYSIMLLNLGGQCGSNEIYVSCPTPCPPTCDQPIGPRICPAFCPLDGCVCAPGYIRQYSGGPCVPYFSCGKILE